MRTKNFLLMSLLLWTFYGAGQNITDGQVVGTVPVGNQFYSVINETGSENYYKTSPHSSTELKQGQSVKLEFSGNSTNQAKVIAANLQSNLYCHLIPQNGGNNPLLEILGNMPVLENEILFFEDTSQIRIFYDLLNAIIDGSNLGMDEMLDLAELQFPGYESYRS